MSSFFLKDIEGMIRGVQVLASHSRHLKNTRPIYTQRVLTQRQREKFEQERKIREFEAMQDREFEEEVNYFSSEEEHVTEPAVRSKKEMDDLHNSMAEKQEPQAPIVKMDEPIKVVK